MKTHFFDIRKLKGLGFRIKSNAVSSHLKNMKYLNIDGAISDTSLSNWFNSKYSIPLDFILSNMSYGLFKKFRITAFYSGCASSHCYAILPTKSSIGISYVVGALVGDGSLYHKIGKSYFVRFEMKDYFILKFIRSLFKHIFDIYRPINKQIRKDGRISYVLRYSNKPLYYFLFKFFKIGPNKTMSVRVYPYFFPFRSYKLAFLLGVYHTDGSISRNNLRFYTSSKHLSRNISNILTLLGYSNNVYQYNRKNYSTEYQITIKNSKSLIRELFFIENRLRNLYK